MPHSKPIYEDTDVSIMAPAKKKINTRIDEELYNLILNGSHSQAYYIEEGLKLYFYQDYNPNVPHDVPQDDPEHKPHSATQSHIDDKDVVQDVEHLQAHISTLQTYIEDLKEDKKQLTDNIQELKQEKQNKDSRINYLEWIAQPKLIDQNRSGIIDRLKNLVK